MSTNLAENSVFAGRYRVVRCIAAGGMGAVYEVVHLETEPDRTRFGPVRAWAFHGSLGVRVLSRSRE